MAPQTIHAATPHPFSAELAERDEIRSRLVAALLSRHESYKRELQRKTQAAH